MVKKPKKTEEEKLAEGYIIIYRPWITTRTGKRIYPKASRFFRLLIKPK